MAKRKKLQTDIEVNPEGVEPVERFPSGSTQSRGRETGYPLIKRASERIWFRQEFQTLSDRHRWMTNMSRFKLAREREQADARSHTFRYNGVSMNRYDMMAHIVMMAYDGWELSRILEDYNEETNILPTPKEVHRWFVLHPDFKEELDVAQKYRGEKYNDLALQIITAVSKNAGDDGHLNVNKEMLTYTKMLYDAFMQQASMANERFTPKTKQQIEEVKEDLTPEQRRERILAMLDNNPSLRTLFSAETKEAKIKEIDTNE